MDYPNAMIMEVNKEQKTAQLELLNSKKRYTVPLNEVDSTILEEGILVNYDIQNNLILDN